MSRRSSRDDELGPDPDAVFVDEPEQTRDEDDEELFMPKPEPSRGLLGNISQMFRAPSEQERRPPLSRRSSLSSRASRHPYSEEDEEDNERWGYASGEEDSEVEDVQERMSDLDYGSYPPSPGASLPLLSADVIFGGESRIDIGEPVGDQDSPPPAGPPSRQTLYVADEDASIRFVGFEATLTRRLVWRLCCIFSLGIVALLGKWLPRMWLRFVAREKAFIGADFVVVEVSTSHDLITFDPIVNLARRRHTGTLLSFQSNVLRTASMPQLCSLP
jgi:cation-transporting P-type ATPase 13A2